MSSAVGAAGRSQREPWEAMAGERHGLAPAMEEEEERNRDSGVVEARFAGR